MHNAPLLVIVGPTGVGKTALAVRLAQDFELEVVSADSRQIYRMLDIGTAKPTPAEQAAVRHHLLDIAAPDQVITLADFQARASLAIGAILQRGHLPALVGGTGQWVKAVIEGWRVPQAPPDYALRAALAAQAERVGEPSLYERLTQVDPEAAAKIDPRNLRRVIRALEVFYVTGAPISRQQGKEAPAYRLLPIGLTMPREQLYERIDHRIEQMLAQGLLAETERLVDAGYGWDLPAMSGLGYRQMGQYLRGEISLAEAVALIKKETRRFIRQQYNWFRLKDERIVWFELEAGLSGPYARIRRLVADFLG
jgi:tRNA dimethylallyltransferase